MHVHGPCPGAAGGEGRLRRQASYMENVGFPRGVRRSDGDTEIVSFLEHFFSELEFT